MQYDWDNAEDMLVLQRDWNGKVNKIIGHEHDDEAMPAWDIGNKPMHFDIFPGESETSWHIATC